MITLKTKNLHKHFGGVKAVNGASLSFESGKITSLIGPNGSGKSTLINLLTGYFPITSGTVVIGESIEKETLKPYEMAEFGVTRTFQYVALFEQMSVMENLLVVLTERNIWKSLFEKHSELHVKQAEDVLKRVGLWEKRNENAENLSYGQRKLLEIGRALAMDLRSDGHANIMFFDEPYAGLFPEMRKVISEILKELRDQGKTIVLVEHSMDLIRELSDHVYVLDAGQLLAEGKPNEVLEDKAVIEAYLGH